MISSIHSYNEFAGGASGAHNADFHYLMDVPSPKFSSVIGDEDDDERTEIIRCLLHQDYNTLQDILSHTMLDITQIRDEMGYSLAHLAAYNNSERCMDLLIHHVLNGNKNTQ